MHSRNMLRDLYSRDTGSQGLSQVDLRSSQDWGMMSLTNSDDSARVPSTPSLHSGWSGLGGYGSQGGRCVPQTPIARAPLPAEGREPLLHKDLRFALHTVLSVIRELPDSLKAVIVESLLQGQNAGNSTLDSGMKDISDKLVRTQELITSLATTSSKDIELSLSQRDEKLAELDSKLNILLTKPHDPDCQKNILKKLFGVKKSLQMDYRSCCDKVTQILKLLEEVRSSQEKIDLVVTQLNSKESDQSSVWNEFRKIEVQVDELKDQMNALPNAIENIVNDCLKNHVMAESVSRATTRFTYSSPFLASRLPQKPLACRHCSPVAVVTPSQALGRLPIYSKKAHADLDCSLTSTDTQLMENSPGYVKGAVEGKALKERSTAIFPTGLPVKPTGADPSQVRKAAIGLSPSSCKRLPTGYLSPVEVRNFKPARCARPSPQKFPRLPLHVHRMTGRMLDQDSMEAMKSTNSCVLSRPLARARRLPNVRSAMLK